MLAEPPAHGARTTPAGAAPSTRDRVAWAVVVALAGVVVPGTSWLTSSAWPTLGLPPLVLAGAWWLRRSWRQQVDAVRQADARAASAMVHDELTACANDAGLKLFGDHLLHAARRRGDAMHAFVIDIDQMSRVNSLLSVAAGDEVLVAVAEAVRASTRGTDVVARGHADEFVVVGPGCGVHPGELERRVRAFLVESPPAPLDVWPCRVTVGRAVLEPWDGGDLEDVVRQAYQDLQLRSAMRAPSAPEPPLTTAT